MDNFEGLFLEESFESENLKEVTDLVTVKKREIWNVSNAVNWQPKKWTAITFEGLLENLHTVVDEMTKRIKPKWFLNISTAKYNYVVFHNKVFKYLKGDKETLKEAQQYALDIGVPQSQIGWESDGLV
ncbi:MAG: hypothetical protein KAQ98_12890 [Bacteriovoracaceae bacterium]|nr:hypothetical protein [Bacteriovoracaceae bacterium]